MASHPGPAVTLRGLAPDCLNAGFAHLIHATPRNLLHECWGVGMPEKSATIFLRSFSYYLSPLLERNGKTTQPHGQELGKEWTNSPAFGFCHQVGRGSFSWRNPGLLR